MPRRDYEATCQDFVTLQFIPPGTDLRPILPALTRVFDAALGGRGAKNINLNVRRLPPPAAWPRCSQRRATASLLRRAVPRAGRWTYGAGRAANDIVMLRVLIQDLASDLARITLAYPFRIPPYFALIVRAISVLEGALAVGSSGPHRAYGSPCARGVRARRRIAAGANA